MLPSALGAIQADFQVYLALILNSMAEPETILAIYFIMQNLKYMHHDRVSYDCVTKFVSLVRAKD